MSEVICNHSAYIMGGTKGINSFCYWKVYLLFIIITVEISFCFLCLSLLQELLFSLSILLFQERQQLEEKMRKQDMEIDYLAPFIARIVQGDKITREEAYTLKTEALKDLKDRLINKANLIQARYEKVRIQSISLEVSNQ